MLITSHYRNLEESFEIKVIPHISKLAAKKKKKKKKNISSWCSETGGLLKLLLCYLFCHSGDIIAFEKSTNYNSIIQQEGTVSME